MRICIPLNGIGCRTCAEQVGVTSFWVSRLKLDLAVRNEGDPMDFLDLVACDFSVVRLDCNGGASSVTELAAVCLGVLPSNYISFLPFPVFLLAYIIRLWKTSSERPRRGTISPTIMRSMTVEACSECRCPGRVIGEIERVLETRSSVCG